MCHVARKNTRAGTAYAMLQPPHTQALASERDLAIKHKYAVFFVLFLLGLLAYTAQKNVPIPTGDAEDYWEFACGVELEKFDGYFPYAHWTGIFPNKDGWYFYYYQEHHGRHVFKVTKQSLLNQVGEVFTLLDQEILTTVQDKTRDDTLAAKNKRRQNCLEIKNTVNSDRNSFIEKLSSKGTNDIDREDEIESFHYQWERGKVYWASILFEAIFLPFWWLFAFHSGMFGKFNRKRSTRLAFSPLLLFVPHYLGYAPYLFSFGSSGGILYPLFAVLISTPFGWVPFNPIEIELLKLLPQPLSYISQVPFSPMAMSFNGSVSPTVLCAFAGMVLIFSKPLVKYRARNQS